jgi:uncharacterized membrane protein
MAIAGQMKHPFFIAFFAVLAIALVPLALFVDKGLVLIVAFDIAAVVFLAAVWRRMGRAAPGTLRQSAADNDAGRGMMLVIASLVLLAVMVSVGLELQAPERGAALKLGVSMLTLTLAWFFGNVLFAIHYAHMFYDRQDSGKDAGGLDFPGDDAPDFSDFVYFAFVLGMTFQVSDVQISSRRIRRMATMHGLAAFFFNLGVLALSINVVGAYLTR